MSSRFEAFAQACAAGDHDALRALLAEEPALAAARLTSGATGLHLAVRHPAAVRVLLEHGADPNARDAGDQASPLHVAAAQGQLESVRLLLDAGADPQGEGDLHHGDVIGWASRPGNDAIIDLLLARGARHHIFSAMARRDYALVERLVKEDPRALTRRRSRFENGHTPVHAAFAPPDGLGYLTGEPDYRMLALLIALGADVHATDDKGRTPLALAQLRGDRDAMRLLIEAGARPPAPVSGIDDADTLAPLAAAVQKSTPMFRVPDMRATVGWYRALGFSVLEEFEDGSELIFARLALGVCELTLSPGATTGPREVSVWLFTDRIEDLYHRVRARQLRAVSSTPAPGDVEVRFTEDLYTPFYGGRQFSIQDPNGLNLIFWQKEST